MKKIYQIVFTLLFLFFTGHENLVLGQSNTQSPLENIKSLSGNISLCSVKTDSTNQITPSVTIKGVSYSETDTTTRINKLHCYHSVSSLSTNQPLYVIDGYPIDNDSLVLTQMNPENIESVSVLKGVVATALYGFRGQNGVILITLKKEEKIIVEEESTVKVEEISINVFPNPTSESVNITLNLKEKSEIEIIMYNLRTLESHEVSKEIYEAGEQKINWNVDSLQKGTYNIKIKIGNQIFNRKLLIER
ncbi:outer membrane receptor protein [Bernardetia litoralis DSM 6794]|uniref:Outer membrane receptor protein n=1 Tax=Bernardetia litoralis (strain ATCC 23117 / DSM 6794 / NBRC 15988 / NCIMB 1366 / Fx l1 / Sio-4) TaxID=880071 RepID=I4AI06_BERLS|nr:outer membrane receptor protein [Bernardetia litoralis DSM 6794]